MTKYKVAFINGVVEFFCNTIGGSHFASTDLNEAYQWKQKW